MTATNNNEQPDFGSVKDRLAEIAQAVDDENLSLDAALDLYEEAVALGLKASDLLETGIKTAEEEAPADSEQQPEAQTEPSSDSAPSEAGVID